MTFNVTLIDTSLLTDWMNGQDPLNIGKNPIIVDIREPHEYQIEHIEGSYNVPMAQLSSFNFDQFKGKSVIFHCNLGRRTVTAEPLLQQTGLERIFCLKGGIVQWKQCGLKTVSSHTYNDF